MELSLSLGDSFMASHSSTTATACKGSADDAKDNEQSNSNEPSLHLHLLPLQTLSSASENRNFEAVATRGFDVNWPATAEEAVESSSSPNSSTVSSFQLELSAHVSSGGEGGVAGDGGTAGPVEPTSIGSDDEENGATRKKLRLSKDQSAFLEESFKEHSTLNPKRKVALAKQLNLQPRQVEVWFQNRRARSKLKQTEVDCEYLKRCCEKLTEENRRLQRELAELRALKTSNPFYTHLPATTLSMCPSCERVASTNASANTTAGATAAGPSTLAASGEQRPNSFAALFSKSRLFAGPQPPVPSQRPKAAS